MRRIASAVVRGGKTPMELFDAVDTNHDGELSRTELERVLRSFQPDLTALDILIIFDTFDADHSGTVSSHEFCTALDKLAPGAFVTLEKKIEHLGKHFQQLGLGFHDSFRAFDYDADGILCNAEWHEAIRHLAPELTWDGAEAIFRKFDKHSKGFLNLAEFFSFFERSNRTTPRCMSGMTGRCHSQNIGETFPTLLCSRVSPREIAAVKSFQKSWHEDVLDTVKDCLSFARSGVAIYEVFARLNTSKSGFLDSYEFDRMVLAYYPELVQHHLQQLFAIVNRSGSGQITQSEFIQQFA